MKPNIGQSDVSFQFYVEFFKAYPELAKNDFYMSGERFAVYREL